MRHQILILPFLSIILFTSCSELEKTPKYETNWPQVKIGMSKHEVVDLLGESYSKSEPGKVGYDPNNTLFENAVGAIIVKTILDDWWERWHYGKFELFENMFSPSDKAYVVYFDYQGKVVHLREPISDD